MLNLSRPRVWRYLLILSVAVILLLSFRTFAAINSATLSSDNAIHILMAYDFQWPEDLYYWGQNRLGSLVPLLGHVVLSILPLPPVIVVSYIQYALLLIGFLCFASLFQRPISKLILALVWFLPLGEFSELLSIGQPYGPQLALIGIALAIIKQLIHRAQTGLKRQILIGTASLSLWGSLWVSDLSVVLLGLLLLTAAALLVEQLWRNWQQKNRLGLSLQALNLRQLDGVTIAVTSSLGVAFVLYAKAHASRAVKRYGLFSTGEQISENIGRLANAFKDTISFRVERPFLAVYALLVLVLLVYLIYLALSKQPQLNKTQARWFYFFLANAVLSFILLVLLYWTYRNPSLRYYTSVYFFGWLALLTYAEGFSPTTAPKVYFLLVLIAVSSSLSLPPRTYRLEAKTSVIQQLEPVRQLGKAGFIGDYWTSYLTCAINPAQLNCTPYDRRGKTPCTATPQNQKKFGFVRCKRCVPKTLNSESIYLIRDQWLEQFPAETQQFGQCLVKAGEPQRIGPFEMALYKKRVE